MSRAVPWRYLGTLKSFLWAFELSRHFVQERVLSTPNLEQELRKIYFPSNK